MLKFYVSLPFAIFAFLTIKQLIFNDTIEWVDNAGIAVTVLVFYLLWDWVGKSSKEDRNK